MYIYIVARSNKEEAYYIYGFAVMKCINICMNVNLLLVLGEKEKKFYLLSFSGNLTL